MASLHVEIVGRVQGVGFRWFVRQHAQRRGLVGWVLNLPNGSVEVAAGGTDSAIAQLRLDIASGPPGAVVNEVKDLAPVAAEEFGNTFSVRR